MEYINELTKEQKSMKGCINGLMPGLFRRHGDIGADKYYVAIVDGYRQKIESKARYSDWTWKKIAKQKKKWAKYEELILKNYDFCYDEIYNWLENN